MNILEFIKTIIRLGHGTTKDLKEKEVIKTMDEFDEIKQNFILIYNRQIVWPIILHDFVPFEETSMDSRHVAHL